MTIRWAAIWIVSLLLIASAAAQTAPKLEALMKQAAYQSAVKVNETTWTLDFSGKQIPKFKVVVSATDKEGSGIITVIANPVAKDQLPRDRAKLTAAIMQANNDFDYVKIGYDKDGDIFVRADIPPSADLASFKTIVEQVAAASDALYGRVKSLLR
jgi:hypothetical protein